MTQAADLWESDDLARIRRMNRTWFRAILLKRQVSSGSMVMVEIRCQDPPQVPFTRDDDVIEAFTPDRSDDAFRVGVLPR